MSYFVSVTYDLRYADPSVYPKVQQALAEINLSKFVTGRKKIDVQLPANLFVAEFESHRYERASELVDFLASELRIVFERFSLRGKFFVSAGEGWAWKSVPFKYE